MSSNREHTHTSQSSGEDTRPETTMHTNQDPAPESPPIAFQDLKRGEKLSQTSISLEAFILGILTGAGTCLWIYFGFLEYAPIWRTPFFLAVLGIFHYCEFYTYARWNLKNMTKESYLTFSNGAPYMIAMSVALIETTFTSLFFQDWQRIWSKAWLQLIGLVLLVLGQFTRHWAIATAGVSFNHHVQYKRRSDHELVTWGPYAYNRHPSYFGFFWWAVGTQLLLGNAISTPIFAIVLWRFFFHRIPIEEKFLIKMFGEEYERFRANTPIGIPLMGTFVEPALQQLRSRTP